MNKFNNKLGVIYILENKAMPRIVKIGFTKYDPEKRAEELSSPTGVPLPFKVTESFLVEDPRRVESAIHIHLAKNRVSNDREFFEMSATSAVSEIGFLLYNTRNLKEIYGKNIAAIVNLAIKYPNDFGCDNKQSALELVVKILVDTVGKKEVLEALNILGDEYAQML